MFIRAIKETTVIFSSIEVDYCKGFVGKIVFTKATTGEYADEKLVDSGLKKKI